MRIAVSSFCIALCPALFVGGLPSGATALAPSSAPTKVSQNQSGLESLSNNQAAKQRPQSDEDFRARARAKSGLGDAGSSAEANNFPNLVPGELPANASPESVALWRELCSALMPGKATEAGEYTPPAPIQSFDLSFDALIENNGQHQVQARFLYKAPGYVLSELSNKNILLRGPQGDWLIGKEGSLELTGRENKEDRRQLDNTLNIAHTFATLSNLTSLRVAELEQASAPNVLPDKVKKRLSKTLKLAKSATPEDKETLRRNPAQLLRWLSVTSPDFRLIGENKRSQNGSGILVRAKLGLDPISLRPRVVELVELKQGMQKPSSTLLVSFDKFIERDGYVIPHWMETFQPNSSGSRLSYPKRPTADLFMNATKGRLNPNPKDAAFLPRTKR